MMEVTEQTIIQLVEQGAHNSAQLDNALDALQALNVRMDALTSSQKEMHKELGSKVSLEQWMDHDERIKAIEERYAIKLAWFKAWDTFVRRLKSTVFVLALALGALYVVEKKESISQLFHSNLTP